MKKVFYISSIVLLSAVSCAREKLVDDVPPIPEGERMVFSADWAPSVKSTFASEGSNDLIWEASDKVCVASMNVATGNGSTVLEVMPISIDPDAPASATFLSAKKRSFWVGGNAGEPEDTYGFFALYPASAVGTPSAHEDVTTGIMWLPVTVPSKQDGVHFGRAHICADMSGGLHSRGDVLSGETVAFNNFHPLTALLNFNMSTEIGNVDIKKIVISYHWNGEMGDVFLAGSAALSQAGKLVPTSEVNGLTGEQSSSVEIDLAEPITVNSTSSRILAAVLPSIATGPVQLDFIAFDEDGNPRLEGSRILGQSADDYAIAEGTKYTFTVPMVEAQNTVLALEVKRVYPPEGGSYTGQILSYKYEGGERVAVDWDWAFYTDPSCSEDSRLNLADFIGEDAFDKWFHLMTDPSAEGNTSADGVATFEYGVNANENYDPESIEVDDTFPETAKREMSSISPWGAVDQPWNLSALDPDPRYGWLAPSEQYDSNQIPKVINTSNCYVINQPGHYMLPCVAGNGIKNGGLNESAYVVSDGMQIYVDYLGNSMTNPVIGYTSADAAEHIPVAAFLLWEDVDGMISAPEGYTMPVPGEGEPGYEIVEKLTALSGSGFALPLVEMDLAEGQSFGDATSMWWIQFDILPDKIDQGNAVIAVIDESGQVMWSWHIWTTEYNPYLPQYILPVRSYWSGGRYNFMKRNLGWVMTGTSNRITYLPNTIYVKVWQTTGDKEITVSLRQDGVTLTDANIQHGYGPYWQGGRKDPFTPGVRGADGYMHDVPVYGAIHAESEGAYFISENKADATIADGIRNPHKYYYSSSGSGWFTEEVSEAKASLWNNVNVLIALSDIGGNYTISDIISTPAPAVKTIYDPNPLGFVMPPMDAGGTFFAFFKGGKYENYLSELAGDDTLRDNYVSLLISASEYGALFYASTDKNPQYTGFLPQVGRRHKIFQGRLQDTEDVDIGLSAQINEWASVKTCGGYYSNIVLGDLTTVMLCAYPHMYFGFLTVTSSALPVRSMQEP